jgi:hypothetical protein
MCMTPNPFTFAALGAFAASAALGASGAQKRRKQASGAVDPCILPASLLVRAFFRRRTGA